MAGNQFLLAANRAKQDEFYTTLRHRERAKALQEAFSR